MDIRAIGVNSTDVSSRKGTNPPAHLPWTPGREAAGVVKAVGSEVSEVAAGDRVAYGSIDITLYRDDLMTIGPTPVVGASDLPQSGIDDRNIVIVDDVLYRGRTARAALDELTDWGRPRRIYLCVLVDRGGRELPIHADIVGREVLVMENQRVDVLVPALDGRLGVEIAFLDRESP